MDLNKSAFSFLTSFPPSNLDVVCDCTSFFINIGSYANETCVRILYVFVLSNLAPNRSCFYGILTPQATFENSSKQQALKKFSISTTVAPILFSTVSAFEMC